MEALNTETETDVWPQVAPMLEDAMALPNEFPQAANGASQIGAVVNTLDSLVFKLVPHRPSRHYIAHGRQ